MPDADVLVGSGRRITLPIEFAPAPSVASVALPAFATSKHIAFVPDGWTSEPIRGRRDGDELVVIRSPDGLMVTVDFEERGYRGGMMTYGKMVKDGYSGRGWRKALVEDAVVWLSDVCAGTPKRGRR